MKSAKSILWLLFSMIFFMGCTTGGTKPDQAAGTTESSYDKYKRDRPEAESISSGIADLDKVTNSIAGLYGTTISLTDQTIARMENSPIVSKLEKARDDANKKGTDGEKLYQDEIKKLKGIDKKEYLAYVNSEVDSLKVVVGYLANATKLSLAIAQLNPQSLASNPFAIPGIIESISQGKDQVGFAVEALGWMKEYSDRLEAAKGHVSR